MTELCFSARGVLVIHRKMFDQLAKSWPYVTVNRKEKRETTIAVAKLCLTSIIAAAASYLFVVEILNLNGKYFADI